MGGAPSKDTEVPQIRSVEPSPNPTPAPTPSVSQASTVPSTARNSIISNSSVSMSGEDMWDYIPQDILFYLFSHMDRETRMSASAVCKSWRRIFLSTRKNINLSKRTTARDTTIKSIVEACPNVHAFNVSACWNLTPKTFEYLARLQRLEELDMSECPKLKPIEGLSHLAETLISLSVGNTYSEEELMKLPAILPNLRKLALSFFFPPKQDIFIFLATKLPLEGLCKQIKQLEKKSFRKYEIFKEIHITSKTLSQIIDVRKDTLRELSLRQCDELTNIDFISQCSNLSNLDLSTLGPQSISPQVLTLFSKSLLKLESISLYACPSVNNECLAALSKFVSLRNINIAYCRGFDSADFLLAVANMPSLRYINLNGTKAAGNAALKRDWPLRVRVDGWNQNL